MKKKVLISINDDIFVRNYLNTNSFLELGKSNKLFFCIKKEGVTNTKEIKKLKNLSYFGYDYKQNKYYNNFCLKYLIKNFKKNNTILMSLKVIINFNFFLNIFPKQSKFFNIIKASIFYLLRLINLAYYYILYRLFNFKINYNQNINNDLVQIIKKVKPDIILIPAGGHDIGYFEIVKYSKENKIKTCALIDNWDNLSSRIHPDPKPDNYFVWGKQSKNFGKIFQDIPKKNIHVIGTPRYEGYFKSREKKISSFFKFKYALFVEGFGIQENLSEFFDVIDKEFEYLKNKGIYLKLIYRPHPWRKNQKILDVSIYKNIIIDPQLEKFYVRGLSRNNIQPNLSYYPSLIKNSEFVIAAPSTMVIESTIFWKKIILLAHDKELKFGNFSYLNKIEHFSGISSFPNIIICKNIKNLKNNILSCLKIKKFNKNKIDNLRNYYLFSDKKGYRLRLKNLVKKIYNQNNYEI